jgi:hypothetical protein
MFRFLGYTSEETTRENNGSLLLDQIPDKRQLLGDFKISRFCSG